MKQQFIYQIVGALFAALTISANAIDEERRNAPFSVIRNAKPIRNPNNYNAGSNDDNSSLRRRTNSNKYPKAFDLRNANIGKAKGLNFVSPVKNQGMWGTCWSFGAMAAAECSVQYELYDKYGITPSELPIDFSEMQLGFFAYSVLQDDENKYPSQKGEGVFSYKKDVLSYGGFNSLVVSLLASGIGPTFESEIPYKSKSGKMLWVKVDENGNAIKDENKKLIYEIQPDTWDHPDDYLPYYYVTSGEDWTVDFKQRFNSKIRLEHANYLPSPNVRNEQGKYKFDRNGVNAIKDELLKGHAVEITFRADSSRVEDLENPPIYISSNYAHYTYNENESANHSVCIVGYDDKYSKSKFIKYDKQGHRVLPPANGAFIVKNSWGSKDDGMFYKWGFNDTGYFYISYYDKSLSLPSSYDFNIINLTEEDKKYVSTIDQHDLTPSQYGWEVMTDNKSKYAMANIFKPTKRETLESVSAYVFTPNSEVEYEVYKLNKKYTSPVDGKLVGSGTEKIRYSGFHVMDLPKPVKFKVGDAYSIVIRQKDEQGNYFFGFSMGYSKEFTEDYNTKVPEAYRLPYYAISIVNKGESFLYSEADNKWIDETDIIPYYTKVVEGDTVYENGRTIDNFPIKGYAKTEKPKQSN